MLLNLLTMLTSTTITVTGSWPCCWIFGQDERPEGHRRRRTAKLEKKYGHLLKTTR